MPGKRSKSWSKLAMVPIFCEEPTRALRHVRFVVGQIPDDHVGIQEQGLHLLAATFLGNVLGVLLGGDSGHLLIRQRALSFARTPSIRRILAGIVTCPFGLTLLIASLIDVPSYRGTTGRH